MVCWHDKKTKGKSFEEWLRQKKKCDGQITINQHWKKTGFAQIVILISLIALFFPRYPSSEEK